MTKKTTMTIIDSVSGSEKVQLPGFVVVKLNLEDWRKYGKA